MHMEMTSNLRLGSSRVVVFGTEEIKNRQNGTSLHKQKVWRTVYEVLWATHNDACSLQFCAVLLLG